MFKVTIKKRNGQIHGGAEFNDLREAQKHAQVIQAKKADDGLPYFLVQSIEDMIENLSLNPEWVEKKAIENRKLEYPPIDSVVEALIEHIAEGRPQKLQEIQAQREAIKIKYPKQGSK